MVWLGIALFFALLAGLGRQIIVFTRFSPGLRLFSLWHWLRFVLVGGSLLFAIPGAIQAASGLRVPLLGMILFLNGFAFFFEMSFFFPEVKAVRRGEGHALPPDTQVLGIVVEETPAAYPIEDIVMPRHIVHDTIEGHPVLISYCALCRSALAFSAVIDEQSLYFKVAGVWRRNMIMTDVQTRSIWQQATGECIFGRYQGRQLALLPSENTTWKRWQRKYPDSEVAVEFDEARRGLLSRDRMLAALKAVTSRVVLPGMTDLRGLPRRETVFGVVVNGQARAYARSRLTNGRVFVDHVAGVALTLTYDGEADSLSVVRRDTGEAVPVEKHWWLGWKEFHPETEIWQEDEAV